MMKFIINYLKSQWNRFPSDQLIEKPKFEDEMISFLIFEAHKTNDPELAKDIAYTAWLVHDVYWAGVRQGWIWAGKKPLGR